MGTLNPLSTYKGLSSSIYFLFIARTINSLGDFVYPLITIYLTLKLGMSENQTGIFVMLAGIAAAPGSLIGGYLGDLIGRKKIIIFGQFFSAILILSCTFFINTLTVAYLLIVSMFFISITRPIYNAMLIDLTFYEEERKSAFSLMYLGINIGIAIGPLIAGFFFEDYIIGVFVGISFTTLISTLLIMFYVKETIQSLDRFDEDAVNLYKDPERGNFLKVIIKEPILLFFILCSFLNFFIYIQYSFSMPIQINSLFGVNGPIKYGLIMTINAISVIILTPVLTSITKGIMPILVITFGAMFYAFGFGMLYFMNNFLLIALATVVWTIGEILVQTNLNVYIAKHSPKSYRGRFNGLLLFIGSVGSSLGPYIMGIYINIVGINLVWPLIFGLGLLYALLMFSLYYYEKNFQRKKL